eukprot:TRINITY_DN16397_c0_g1_i1.p2 TRINITY_DN16397_c0_g1~~TRINITY_DN16397_c0_g1_i1.p2  ORF type:complete len:124 (-),score=6.27 TRINITY_DN16397_c0_g1_i1:357-728(-)
MIRRPPRSTHCISSAASDVYKRQYQRRVHGNKLYHREHKHRIGEKNWKNIGNYFLTDTKKTHKQRIVFFILRTTHNRGDAYRKTVTTARLNFHKQLYDRQIIPFSGPVLAPVIHNVLIDKHLT